MQNRKLTREEFHEIETLVNNILVADTKADAAHDMQRLRFLNDTMPYEVAPNIRFMLSELRCSADTASGRVREKEHWVDVTKRALYKLESFGVGEDADND